MALRRPPRAWAWTVAGVAAVACAAGLTSGVVMPPPEGGRARHPQCARESVAPAGACAQCHAEIVAQWRATAHAAAFDDPIFQAEFAPIADPAAGCTACHAQGQADHGHPARDGVDCSGCHPPARIREAAGLTAAALRDGVSMCARCHQFNFAAGTASHGTYDPADPQQDTVAEWRSSLAAARGQTCVDCHMPGVVGGAPGRGHRLRDTSDRALLAAALRVDAEAQREAEGIGVRLTLRPGAVGHRVPTGDLFRRLRVRIWVDDPQVPEVERWRGRFFGAAPASDGQGFVLRPVLDDRVPAPGTDPPVHIEARLEPSTATQVHWAVELHRMPPPQARARGLSPGQVRVPIAAGRVPVATGPGV